MTEWPHGWSGLLAGLNADQHLAVDAVVAFVDGELGPGAHDRAAEHLAHCPSCATEVAAQRQVRSAVRAAPEPTLPSGLLAALCSIPQTAQRRLPGCGPLPPAGPLDGFAGGSNLLR